MRRENSKNFKREFQIKLVENPLKFTWYVCVIITDKLTDAVKLTQLIESSSAKRGVVGSSLFPNFPTDLLDNWWSVAPLFAEVKSSNPYKPECFQTFFWQLQKLRP